MRDLAHDVDARCHHSNIHPKRVLKDCLVWSSCLPSQEENHLSNHNIFSKLICQSSSTWKENSAKNVSDSYRRHWSWCTSNARPYSDGKKLLELLYESIREYVSMKLSWHQNYRLPWSQFFPTNSYLRSGFIWKERGLDPGSLALQAMAPTTTNCDSSALFRTLILHFQSADPKCDDWKSSACFE